MTVNESTTAVSENGSDVIVVRFVKKIEDGGSRKQLKKGKGTSPKTCTSCNVKSAQGDVR